MIKVLHLITDLDIGGAETMLLRLLSHTDRSRFHSSVVAMAGRGDLCSQVNDLGVPLYSLGMRTGIPDIRAVYKLSRILKRERPHIIQTWLYHADLLGLITAKLTGFPYVIWNLRCSELHRGDHSALLFAILRVLAKLSKLPTAVVANSSAGVQAHERIGYQPRKWVSIFNGFDTNIFEQKPEARANIRRELNLEEDIPLVGLIGRFNPMKDHGNFLKAACLVQKMRPDAHFILAGRGVDNGNNFLTERISSLGLESVVHLLGECRNIVDIYSSIDVVCSSSYSEGFPSAIGEAMACGVPCVVTDVGDSAYIVGNTGCVVPPRNPDFFAKAIIDIISLPLDEKIDLGIKARQRITDNFSIEKITNQYEALYQDIAVKN